MHIKLRIRSLLHGFIGVLCTLTLPNAVYASENPFIGEIACGGWNFCPSGWMSCDGQLLPISSYPELFTLIGTTYGGDGQSSFALPDLRGRTMVHQGAGPGLSPRTLGQTGGLETVTLTVQQIPAHSHTVVAHTGTEKSASPQNAIAGTAPSTVPVFTSSLSANIALNSAAVTSSGASQAHNNRQPYLTVKCCISLYGIFPSPQ